MTKDDFLAGKSFIGPSEAHNIVYKYYPKTDGSYGYILEKYAGSNIFHAKVTRVTPVFVYLETVILGRVIGHKIAFHTLDLVE